MLFVKIAGALLFAASTAYLLLALFRVSGFRERAIQPKEAPPITIMIPCHGAPPRLLECLRSICTQDYTGEVQIVFGLHSLDDDARPLIEGLMAELAPLDTALVIDATRAGANPKNCNLANMMAAVKHDVIAVVDSDVLVEPGFLGTIVAPLSEPGVGCVTCMYKGVPNSDFASRMGALYINDWFVPSVLVDVGRQGAHITYGAAAALTRKVLDDIGGFAAMANAVAQDYVLGHEVKRAGYKIALAPMVVGTVVAEGSIPKLLGREMRWMRAIRSVRPLDYVLWILTSALVPLALLSFAWPADFAIGAIAIHIALRMALHYNVRQATAMPSAEPLMAPVREALNFWLWLTSLFGRRIRWGNNVMITGNGLTMHVDPNATANHDSDKPGRIVQHGLGASS